MTCYTGNNSGITQITSLFCNNESETMDIFMNSLSSRKYSSNKEEKIQTFHVAKFERIYYQ